MDNIFVYVLSTYSDGTLGVYRHRDQAEREMERLDREDIYPTEVTFIEKVRFY